MADYPGALPPADIQAAGRNHGAGWDEVYAIAAELGISPSGPFATVLARLIATQGLPPSSRPSGSYYHGTGRRTANSAFAQNRLIFLPIELFPDLEYTRIGTNVYVAGGAGAVLRYGLWKRASDGSIGDFVGEYGPVAADSTGVKEVTISVTPNQCAHYVGVVAQGSATTPQIGNVSNNGVIGTGLYLITNGETQGYAYQAGVSGALPSVPSGLAYDSHPVPIMYMGKP